MNAKSYIKNIAQNEEHREGPIARTIEQQTAKLPSDTFLWLAVGSIVASATLQVLGRRETSNFVGQWAPTLLILGLYNKLVKTVGSDREENQMSSSQSVGGMGGSLSGSSSIGGQSSSTGGSSSGGRGYGDDEEGLQHTAAL